MSANGKRVAVVAAEFNKELVDAMVEVAENALRDGGAVVARVVRVPGAYETPLAADLLLARDEIDAVVVLGYIERGETLHGEVMGHVVHAALVGLQLKRHKPVGMGIIGPGATPEQAQARKVSSARSAVQAVLRCCDVLADLRPGERPA